MDCPRSGRVRSDDEPPPIAPRGARRRVPFSTLPPEDEQRSRDGTVKTLFRTPRRAPGRSRADALPRRTTLGLRLLAIGLPADVHLLRDGAHDVREEPHRLGDPRPGPPLSPLGPGEPSGVHGDGRAVHERRRGARRRPAPSRPRHHPPADDDLDGRLDPRPQTVRGGGRRADPASRSRCTPPIPGSARS